jgi:membrane protein
LRGLLGADAAAGLQKIIVNFNRYDTDALATAVGIGTLLFGATTFFATLQESLNDIWNLKPKPKNGLLQWFKTRVLSLGLVLSVGLLLLISLVLSAGLAAFSLYLREQLPNVTVALLYILDVVLSLGLITVVFALLFRYLPDARVAWRNVWPGAILTAVLFVIGKYLIGLYMTKADPGSAYGAASSVVVLLVWVYYSALLVFFGAEFTQEFLARFGEKIQPNEYAVGVIEKELAPGQPAPATKSEGSAN